MAIFTVLRVVNMIHLIGYTCSRVYIGWAVNSFSWPFITLHNKLK